MQTTLKWVQPKRDSKSDAQPVVSIVHHEYCGGCNKHVTFQFGTSVVEIHTNEAGLKQIKDAIDAHPDQMRKAAEETLKKAIAEAERLGVTVP